MISPRPPSADNPARVARLWQVMFVAYGCVLAWMTHAPDVRAPSLPNSAVETDKALHFVAYAVLGFLASKAAVSWTSAAGGKVLLVLSLCAVAGVDEITQPLTERDAELGDWFADVAGIVFGIAAAAALNAIPSRCARD